MEPELPPEYVDPTELHPCKNCGRNFNSDTLVRHQVICIKNKKKDAARKPFDTAKFRAMGTELESYNIQKKYNKTTEDRLQMIAYERQAQKKKQWKRKHDEFVNTIRAAREYDRATKTGASLPPVEPSAPNPDYVQCPYCKRRFQEHAAERHIPFCKEQNSRIERKITSTTTGASSLNKRLKYKPPSIRKRIETEGHSENHHPPGSSLVQRQTNFSSTYTVTENAHGTDYCYPGEGSGSGARAGPGSRAGSSSKQSVGGTTAQHLPGNTPGHYKPHPPSKLAPPRLRSRLVHLKQAPENRTDHSVVPGRSQASHTGMNNGYLSESDEQDYPHQDNSSNSAQNTSQQPWRGREGEQLSHGDRHQHPLLSKRGSMPKIMRSDSNHSDSSIPHHNGYIPDSHDHVTSTKLYMTDMQDRVNSNSSSNGSGSGRSKHSQQLLNVHGMTMAKFCYECGSGFPVPQAKYCCECGTKRI